MVKVLQRAAIRKGGRLAVLGLLLVFLLGADKLKPEEVVTAHLNSIASAGLRAAVQSRIAEGQVQMQFITGGQGTLVAKGAIISEGPKFRIAMAFRNQKYWAEDFSFDGVKTDVGFMQPAAHTNLGTFFIRNDQLLREGLLGGALSTAWPLLDLENRQAKLEYDGLKKVDGRELHSIRYQMKNQAADLSIQLLFEPETFRHVKTVYIWTESARIGRSSDTPNLGETRYTLEESFEGFQSADGVTLPTKWKLRYSNQGSRRGGYLQEWVMTVANVYHNQKIDPRNYVIVPPGN